MEITSIYYLIFLAGVILLYWIIPPKSRWCFLLACSMVFYYFCGDIRTIIYICITVITVYCSTWFILKHKTGQRLIFVITLCINVGLLAVLKYNVLFINIANIVFKRNYNYFEFITPLAVSFYTLQILGYFIECYKMRYDSEQLGMYMEKNPLKLFLLTTFFPLMTSGPISKYENLKCELFELHTINYNLITNGLKRIAWGLIKKRVIADPLALPVGVVFNNFSIYGGVCIWLATVLYGIQLYIDFSGCMDIVIGTANCFGMKLSENFNSPYLARSIKDFWRRWHISLSTWLRNYVYIPLGGNKKGTLIKYRNLLITFLVSGLWHGGSFKFIFWGGIHGLYQICEDVFGKYVRGRIQKGRNNVFSKISSIIITLFLVMVGWLIFRANSLKDAMLMLKEAGMIQDTVILLRNWWTEAQVVNNAVTYALVLCGIVIVFIVDILHELQIDIKKSFQKQPFILRLIEYWFVVALSIYALCDVTAVPQFIYNQF